VTAHRQIGAGRLLPYEYPHVSAPRQQQAGQPQTWLSAVLPERAAYLPFYMVLGFYRRHGHRFAITGG